MKVNKVGLSVILILSFLFLDSAIVSLKKKDLKVENTKAIYISYLEYMDNFMNNSKSINESKIDNIIENIKYYKFNTIILHVSPFSDAIYKSNIFPYSYTLSGVEGKNPGFDYLEYFLKKAHLNKIKIYAWINPYRIRSDSNIDKISVNNPAYQLLDTTSVKVSNSGIYYNPASELVKNIIINQVKEIIHNYDVDGIHFDDYFYVLNNIDEKEYQESLKNNNISLSNFRLNHTNDLIKRVYKEIKNYNKNIVFSISPDGNINNNYKYHYADIKTWCDSNQYIDMIMPQLYYGFYNEYRSFNNSLNEWKNIVKNKDIKLVPILGFYKVGLIDNGAGYGKDEWINNNDIIKKQVVMLKSQEYNDFGIFRYDFLFNKNYFNNKTEMELKNLYNVM